MDLRFPTISIYGLLISGSGLSPFRQPWRPCAWKFHAHVVMLFASDDDNDDEGDQQGSSVVTAEKFGSCQLLALVG